jgi:ABC-type transport system involved in multi-copper enzyme maturation permease subunit
MTFSLHLYGVGVVLVLIQLLAAVPWLLVFNWDWIRSLRTKAVARSFAMRVVLVSLAIAVVSPIPFATGLILNEESLEWTGRIYGSILHLQLLADFLVGVFCLLLLVWPKGGAVALAAFREGVRQPLFWLLALAAFLLMGVSPFIPYFTFGEDHVVVQELGYDTIMLTCVVLGVLAASMSISEEIEGRTAITLMSKPVSRRQFLLGKFLGIFLVTVLLTGCLGWFFQWTLLCKHWFDRLDPIPTPAAVTATLDFLKLSAYPSDLLRGVGLWIMETYATLPGLAVGLCQVMVLLAIAVSLATRLPMVANLVVCFVVYILGHLTPVLAQIAARKEQADPNAPTGRLLAFTSQVFDIGLPGLEFFSLAPALVADPQEMNLKFLTYIGSVVLYGVMYTVIALLFGLVLFEDRDLA